jgi:hypothetical protein
MRICIRSTRRFSPLVAMGHRGELEVLQIKPKRYYNGRDLTSRGMLACNLEALLVLDFSPTHHSDEHP